MSKVSEERMRLRIEYSRQKGLIFSDNIPLYADWLENKLAFKQSDITLEKKQVIKAFNQFFEATDIIEKYKEQETKKIRELGITIDTRSVLLLDLEVRSLNALQCQDIETIGELLSLDRSELQSFRNVGRKTITNINKKIKEFGIETTPFVGGYE